MCEWWIYNELRNYPLFQSALVLSRARDGVFAGGVSLHSGDLQSDVTVL